MRVTLDTNIWSRLAERGEVDRFEELEDALGFQLVIPPSTLMEALRTRDPSLRDQIVQAITSRGRTRIHVSSEAGWRRTSSSWRSPSLSIAERLGRLHKFKPPAHAGIQCSRDRFEVRL